MRKNSSIAKNLPSHNQKEGRHLNHIMRPVVLILGFDQILRPMSESLTSSLTSSPPRAIS